MYGLSELITNQFPTSYLKLSANNTTQHQLGTFPFNPTTNPNAQKS